MVYNVTKVRLPNGDIYSWDGSEINCPDGTKLQSKIGITINDFNAPNGSLLYSEIILNLVQVSTMAVEGPNPTISILVYPSGLITYPR